MRSHRRFSTPRRDRAAMPDADPRRWVAPADLAEMIVFLASPANRVTRGAVIPVYGGVIRSTASCSDAR